MLKWIGVLSIVVLANTSKYPMPNNSLILPKTYKDVFAGSSGGRVVYGSTQTTCWARGGVCVNLRECRHMVFDSTVSGCQVGFKVCCKIQRFGPAVVHPFVTNTRRHEVTVYSSNLEELNDGKLEDIATNNYNILRRIKYLYNT